MERDQPDSSFSWYQSFDENHGSETRRQWYGKVAKAYRWARPRYPDSLIDDALSKAGLTGQWPLETASAAEKKTPEPSAILEIGCGPGIATQALAARGFRVQAVEPSASACELARESCKAHPNVTVHEQTFEDYPLAGQTFDAVLAATSFHWVSPAVACQKSAAALKPNGSLILLWATPPQLSEEICDYLQPVYSSFDLSELGRNQRQSQEHYAQNFHTFARTVHSSGLFQLTEMEIQTHQSTYSVEKYLALLSSLSPYIELPEQTRLDLLSTLGTQLTQWLIDNVRADALDLTHWFAAQVAPLSKPQSSSDQKR